jgi:glycosyltransferase involved in cell wall biosynthesis
LISVVHIITQLELGGAQENTLTTCAGLDQSRFRVLLVHGPDGLLDHDAKSSLSEERIRVVPSLVREPSPRRDAEALAALTRILRLERARHEAAGDSPGALIVHTHSSKAGILGRLAARAAGIRHVVHSIHGFGFHEGQPRLRHAAFLNAERAAARLTECFISVSRANLAEAWARHILEPRHKTALIRSGFDLTAFRAEAAHGPELRAELGFGPEDELIVSIANLKPQKDPLTLVEAMRILAARRPRAVLLYAGDGELRGPVEAAVRAAGLDRRFVLLGWRRDVASLIGAGDVIALSSIFEGLPRAAVQALAAHRPVVATRVDGTSEVVRDGRNGFLVEPRDPEAFARALEQALDERPVDPTDDERIRDWDAAVMVRQQEALYQELVEAA